MKEKNTDKFVKSISSVRFYLLLISLVLLVSCGNHADLGSGIHPEERLVIMDAAASAFQVVRSDLLTGNDAPTQAAIAIVSGVQQMTGYELNLVTDYTGKGGAAEVPYEILVGETNRKESAQAMEQLGDEEGYRICVIGNKICVVASNDRQMEAAVQAFLAQCLYYEDSQLFVANSLTLTGSYQLPEDAWLIVPAATGSGSAKYDLSVSIACVQGIMNRESQHKVYVQSNQETADWLEILRRDGRWLSNVNFVELKNFEELLKYGRDYIKTVILWDVKVPATVNVACTVAGVEDGIVFTPAQYEQFKGLLNTDVKLIDLVGKFDGSDTGSAKNEAYQWAIENYLEKGLCSTAYICSYIDSWSHREAGNTSYSVVRDWGIYQGAFVYDLSPWMDEVPLDDPEQSPGADHSTLMRIFDIMLENSADQAPYEVCGFFEHQKYSQAGKNTESKHSSVHTEWEYAALMTPYNGYHNTCIDSAWNESFHALYRGAQQLTGNRPDTQMTLVPGKVYLCLFMGDYDSTHPVYRYLKQAWDDPRRGELPFAWAINPNLLETYPDLIEYYYETASNNDYFVSDASAAGYFMPSRVPDELWGNFLKHNQTYFARADMTIAPMILDRFGMDSDDLDRMAQIATDGLGTVIQNKNFMYNGIPVAALLGSGYDRNDPVKGAQNMATVVKKQFSASNSGASLNLLRCVWTTPTVMCETVELLRETHPEYDIEVVDIYTYYDLLRQDMTDFH